jgi:hypothetical protein
MGRVLSRAALELRGQHQLTLRVLLLLRGSQLDSRAMTLELPSGRLRTRLTLAPPEKEQGRLVLRLQLRDTLLRLPLEHLPKVSLQQSLTMALEGGALLLLLLLLLLVVGPLLKKVLPGRGLRAARFTCTGGRGAGAGRGVTTGMSESLSS